MNNFSHSMLASISSKSQYFQYLQPLLFVSSGMKTREEKDDFVTIPKKEYDDLRHSVILLQQELANVKRMLFGKKSERYIPEDPSQLRLSLEAQQAGVSSDPGASPKTANPKVDKKKTPKREALPGHLPRVEKELLPEIDLSDLVRIGESTTEYLDYKPGKLIVIKLVRPRYLNPKTEEFVMADLPPLPLPSSNAGPGLLSHIIVSKYTDHLPFYRQSKMFKRDQDVHLAESTMNNWFSGTCRLLDPLYQKLKEEVQNSDYIQADETPIPVLTKDKPGSTHKGYQWVYHAVKKKLVCFDYNKGRGSEVPKEFFQRFQGALQTDAFASYDQFLENENIQMLGCWAHARRYFEHALKNDKDGSEYALKKIQALYNIEREIKVMDPENGQSYRKKESEPILREFKTWLDRQLPDIIPKSSFGKAVRYTYSIWKRLVLYKDNPSWLIDNNRVENTIRPVALGRKNYMFAGSHEGAQRAAMMYSFLGSCKLIGVNPNQWLAHVLSVIQDHKANKLIELLPSHFKE